MKPVFKEVVTKLFNSANGLVDDGNKAEIGILIPLTALLNGMEFYEEECVWVWQAVFNPPASAVAQELDRA